MDGLRKHNNRVNMAYVGQVPWHGMGVILEQDATVQQILEAAGITDLVAESQPLFLEGQGDVPIPGFMASVVRDTESGHIVVAGVVSEGYQHVQYEEMFAPAEGLVTDGIATVETAGVLGDGGERAWLLLKASDRTVRLADGREEQHQGYIFFIAGHDGRTPVQIAFTRVRVVCANTWSEAIGDVRRNKGKRFSAKHTRNVADRVVQAHVDLQAYFRQTEVMDDLLVELSKRSCPQDEAVRFFERYLDATRGAVQQETDADGTLTLKAQNRRDEVDALLDLFANGAGNGGNTRYDAFQAITDYADHSQLRAQNEERRFLRLVAGTGAQDKQKALQILVEEDGASILDEILTR